MLLSKVCTFAAFSGQALAASNYMKHIFLILSFFAIFSGFSQNLGRYTSVIRGSEECFIEKKDLKNIVVFHPDYKIYLHKNNGCGESITIISRAWHDTILSIKMGPIYFYGIYKGYLFIDNGTGVLRSMTIFNLKGGGCFIFSFGYNYEPLIRNYSIFYDHPFNYMDVLPDKLPNCPDSLLKSKSYGYTEKRIFILKSKKSINTGEIKCEYRE